MGHPTARHPMSRRRTYRELSVELSRADAITRFTVSVGLTSLFGPATIAFSELARRAAVSPTQCRIVDTERVALDGVKESATCQRSW